MTKQQKEDYYYGYNLRLADELREYDEHINQPASLEGKKRLSEQLEERLLQEARESANGWSREWINTEIFNPRDI